MEVGAWTEFETLQDNQEAELLTDLGYLERGECTAIKCKYRRLTQREIIDRLTAQHP